MTAQESMELVAAVERIATLQREGKAPRTISISSIGVGEEDCYTDVFLISVNTPAELPEGNVEYKLRSGREYPWEAYVKVGSVKYYALIPEDECWKLYLDFAA